MRKNEYKAIEAYMLSRMKDVAHDPQHIYRVLYHALDIARDYPVDSDVLIAAALLHDIGRQSEYKSQSTDHAQSGAELAYVFLLGCGWSEAKAAHVHACVASHRFRTDLKPDSVEAKILFDADKLDATGTVGIARTIMYSALVGQPLYTVDGAGRAASGENSRDESVFQEYHRKLKGLYERFYTKRAGEIARLRRQAAIDCYECLYGEVSDSYNMGTALLKELLNEN